MAHNNCKECRDTYDEYKEEGYDVEPPCKTCFPGVHVYNKDILDVFSFCRNQVIVGMSGAIAINMDAVDKVLEHRPDLQDDYLYIQQGVSIIFSVMRSELVDKS